MNNRGDDLKLTPSFPYSFSVVHDKEQTNLKERVGKSYRGELFPNPQGEKDEISEQEIHKEALAPLCGNRESALDNSPSMVP